ncbi:hypothetical protein [Nocardia sp. NBC_01327]|uniref:hypothetical protein n=1 Tax=Nocardia sp. NBC_01327 TaxID=2903593 RepID=UPI002E0F817B|nr:hypothetical protein OG326_33605 [Nocardia sp. NBC_01327]
MALIRGSARYLLIEAQAGRLHQLLSEQARHQWEHQAGAGEVRSWMRSLPPLLNELVDSGLGDIEVLLEHKLPHSPKRVDVILCGVRFPPNGGRGFYAAEESAAWSDRS